MRRWRELYSKRARGQEAKVGYLFLKVAVLLFRKYTFARVIADFRLPIANFGRFEPVGLWIVKRSS